MIEMIILGIGFALLFALIILFHELGHVLMLYKFGKQSEIKYTGKYIEILSDYDSLSKWQYILVMFAGVVSGIVPAFIFYNVLYGQIGLAMIFCIYSVGCYNDLAAILDRLIIKTIKEEKTMAEIIYEVKDITHEKGYLYFVTFKKGYLQVGKAKMARGGKKQK